MLLSYTIVDFHLFYDGAVDIQIWAPPTRSQCKVCDTQVTVKACRPLVFLTCWFSSIHDCQNILKNSLRSKSKLLIGSWIKYRYMKFQSLYSCTAILDLGLFGEDICGIALKNKGSKLFVDLDIMDSWQWIIKCRLNSIGIMA